MIISNISHTHNHLLYRTISGLEKTYWFYGSWGQAFNSSKELEVFLARQCIP